jgi:hypothetical protein
MKYLLPLVLCAATAAQAGIPVYDFSAGNNEAVHVLPGGRLVVDEPPGPRTVRRPTTKPSFWAPGVYLPSYVIASRDGLKECGWPWLDTGCRPYVPKQDRRERAWVVKRSGQWLKCPHRDTSAGCVGYYALPNMAVQD